jgi:hypothetical protein
MVTKYTCRNCDSINGIDEQCDSARLFIQLDSCENFSVDAKVLVPKNAGRKLHESDCLYGLENALVLC